MILLVQFLHNFSLLYSMHTWDLKKVKQGLTSSVCCQYSAVPHQRAYHWNSHCLEFRRTNTFRRTEMNSNILEKNTVTYMDEEGLIS